MVGNWRIAIAFGLIGAMVIALVLLLTNDGDTQPEVAPTTMPSTSTTTATTVPTSTTTSTTAPSTTITLDAGARKAEVARILEDLEIAWYDAVYRGDTSDLANVVAIQLLLDDAANAIGVLDFLNPPSNETVHVAVYELLLDRPDCLVVYRQLDLRQILGPESLRDGVQILWPRENGSYRLARLWTTPGDLWQDDCDLMDRTEVP